MPEFRVIFVAPDYDTTTNFFIDVMGLEVLRSFEEGGKGMLLIAADGLIEIFAAGDGDVPDPVSGASLAWEVADADSEHERLITAGATILRAPEIQPWGHKNFVVQGPDGWAITLFEIVVPQ